MINLNFKEIKIRPRIKIELTPFDILLEVVSIFTLIYIWYLVLNNYHQLPETITTHFSSTGKADDFGSKSFIFLLPSIGILIYVLLTIINRFPHTFNYLKEITEKNAPRQYFLATRMIRFLKGDILIIFATITSFIIKDAQSNNTSLGEWFLPFILTSTFIPILIFIILMLKEK